MPYIAEEDRDAVRPGSGRPAETPGELSFQVTTLMRDYVRWNRTDYQTMNDVLGAVEGAKLEFYRRIVAPYEDRKREINGDVYGDA